MIVLGNKSTLLFSMSSNDDLILIINCGEYLKITKTIQIN